MINFQDNKFNQLSCEQLYAILAARAQVFVVEQNCPYQDLDYLDQNAIHVLGYENKDLAAYARILTYSDSQIMSFGRVLTAPNCRGKGYGKQLIQYCLDYLEMNHPEQTIKISAQAYLQKFYTDFDFIIQGDLFDIDGIPHYTMVKNQ
jgi:ElaA protein